jgi:hypothetical protein
MLYSGFSPVGLRAYGCKASDRCAHLYGQAIDATESDVALITARGMRVHFNPYRSDYFHLDDGMLVAAAAVLAIDHKTAFVLDPCLGRSNGSI